LVGMNRRDDALAATAIVTKVTPSRLRWVGTVVIAATVLIAGVLIAEGMTRPEEIGGLPTISEYIGFLSAYGVYGLVGGLLLRHSIHNPIGILVSVMGIVPLVGNLGEAVVARDFGSGLVLESAVWIVNWYFYAFFGAFLPLFHLLPTGVAMGGWWKWWARIAVIGYGLLVFMSMFGPPEECASCSGVNPLEIPFVTAAAPVLFLVMLAALLAGLGSGVASLGVRYYRSRGVVRAQLKWVFFGVVTSVVLFFGAIAVTEQVGWLTDTLGEAVGSGALVLPGLAILVAVTRHGLFDIDRIVSRTVSYATVALLVVLVYAVPVVVLPGVLGLSSDIAVAGATLLAAAAFAPLRRVVQRLVERRFNRVRYDARETVDRLGTELAATVQLPEIRALVAGAVNGTVGPSALQVWITGGARS
jgi:hypothetical protein